MSARRSLTSLCLKLNFVGYAARGELVETPYEDEPGYSQQLFVSPIHAPHRPFGAAKYPFTLDASRLAQRMFDALPHLEEFETDLGPDPLKSFPPRRTFRASRGGNLVVVTPRE